MQQIHILSNFKMCTAYLTSPHQLELKCTKISALEINIFGLKIKMEFFYFEIVRAPSELLLLSAKQPAQKIWIVQAI